MRSARALLAAASAPDFVATLLRSGRVIDIPIRNHFFSSPAAASSLSKLSQTVRRAAFASAVPSDWRTEAFHLDGEKPSDEWCGALLSAALVRAEPAAEEGGNKWKLTGKSVVCGSEEHAPTSLSLLVFPPATSAAAAAAASFAAPVQVTVPVSESNNVTVLQPAEAATSKGLRQVMLTEAEATTSLSSLGGARSAMAQHLLASYAISGILQKARKTCALHLICQSRFDGWLLRNPAMQVRLAELAALDYGLDSALQYVSSRFAAEDRAEGDAQQNATGDETAGLAEAVTTHTFAQVALRRAMLLVQAMMAGTDLSKALPSSLPSEAVIDYPYLNTLLQATPDMYAAPCGSIRLQTQLLLQGTQSLPSASASAGDSSPLSSLVNLLSIGSKPSGSQGSFSAVHLTFQSAAEEVETDVRKLVAKVKASSATLDAAVLTTVGCLLAEVFASTAALHRGSAALAAREEAAQAQGGEEEAAAAHAAGETQERGDECGGVEPLHRCALLSEAFLRFSRDRRVELWKALEMGEEVSKVLEGAHKKKTVKSMEDCSTHPIEMLAKA